MGFARDPETYNAVKEIERHLHNYEYWCGVAAGHDNDPANPCCDRESTTGYLLTSGDDSLDTGSWVYGPWVCLVGNSDLPNKVGNTKYDPHRINIVEASIKNVPMKVQQAFGATSAEATANYESSNSSDFIFAAFDVKTGDRILETLSRRGDSDMPLWVRLAAKGQNASTISLYLGIHEYQV